MNAITIAIFVLLTSSTTASFAQNCKEVKEKKDAFTNKTEKSARIVIGNLMTKWLVEMFQSDGATTMKWGIAMQGEYNQKLEEGTKLLLKLEDGTVLTLNTSEPTTPITQVLSGGAGTVNVFSQYNLKFNLDKETLSALSSSIITDIKVDVPGLPIKNPKIKSSQMEKVMDVSGCFLKG